MKFDRTKIRLPNFFRKLWQNRQAKYVLFAAVFVILISGAVLAYTVLSRQYIQKMQPQLPSGGTKQVINNGDETETETTGQGKSSETTDIDTETNKIDPDTEKAITEKPYLKESEVPSGTTAGQTDKNSVEEKISELPKTSESAAQTKGTDKPKDTKNAAEIVKPGQETEKNDPLATKLPETEPPATNDPNRNTAPNFTVVDANGDTVSLSDTFGKPIVINFWATWCPPCKQELPDFDKLYKEYGNKVTFMMVNLTDGRRDTVDGTKSFVSRNGYAFPVYFDIEYEGANAYSVSSIPQTTFIDKNGNIFTTRIGAMNEATLRSYIDAMLGG